jgi:hypothetical protein
MTEVERKNLINLMGRTLAEHLKDFYGSVQFNVQGGRYVNANISESVRPEKPEN